jgi:MATE family multidrug resistance protein
MAASGIGAATTVKVGYEQGKRNLEGIRRMGWTGFSIGALWMSLAGLIFFLGRFELPQWYGAEPDVLEMASTLLIIAVLFQISDGVQVVGLGVLRGLSDVKAPTWITFFSYWVIALPLAAYLGLKTSFGVMGVWSALALGLTLSALLLVWRFHRKTQYLSH